MNRSMSELERRLAELEQRFSDIENLNNLLSRQVKEYFLLFDSIRKISSAIRLKDFYKILDKIFKKSFEVDEYGLILKNPKSDMMSVVHSSLTSFRRLVGWSRSSSSSGSGR